MAKAKKPLTKGRKAVKIVGNILTGVFVAFIAFGCFLLISGKVSASKSKRNGAPTSIGNRYLPIIVISDSMEPEYKVNTAIFVRKQSGDKIKERFDSGETIDLTFYDGYTMKSDDLTEETYAVLNEHKKSDLTMNMETTMTHRLFCIQENEGVNYGDGKYFFIVEGINRENVKTGGAKQYQIFTENELYGVCEDNSDFVGGVFKFVQSPLGLVILLLVPSLYMIISSILDLVKTETVNEKATGDDPLANLSSANQKRLKEELLNELINGKGNKE